MTASYLVVTFAAVILVEGLSAALVVPNLNAQADLSSRVLATASDYSTRFGQVLQNVAQSSADLNSEQAQQQVMQLYRSSHVGEPNSGLRPGQERHLDNGVLIPAVTGQLPDSAPMSLAVILGPDGTIYGSSYPERYPQGTTATAWLPDGWVGGGGGVAKFSNGSVVWATQPVFRPVPLDQAAPLPTVAKQQLADGKGGKGDLQSIKPRPLGYVYVQVPFQSTGPSWADLKPQLQAGFVFLLATIPVGVLFGLLTTRGVIQRLRRLAAGTVGFASGDFGQRVPESGVDEVGQLERHFNSMAGRLEEAIAQQRGLAERNARLAERTRISRELHDSISQDLFSMSAIVAGLRKALPNSSPVQAHLDTLTGTVNSTIQEMRALLLELRPTALEEKGLIPALTDLCQAYETRVGVRVSARLEPLTLAPAVEQALFRIAQEGLSNAVRHSEAEEIFVTLRPIGEQADQAELTIVDDGRGFDPAQTPPHGLGLKLMAERVRELGGSLAVESSERAGTTIRVVLPGVDAA